MMVDCADDTVVKFSLCTNDTVLCRPCVRVGVLHRAADAQPRTFCTLCAVLSREDSACVGTNGEFVDGINADEVCSGVLKDCDEGTDVAVGSTLDATSMYACPDW